MVNLIVKSSILILILVLSISVSGYIDTVDAEKAKPKKTKAQKKVDAWKKIERIEHEFQISRINEARQMQATMTLKTLTELLPQRSEIGTIWKISEPFTLESRGFESPATSAIGDKKNIVGEYTKNTSALVRAWKFQFDSQEHALAHYNEKYSQIYNECGYVELATNDINAKCFGTIHDLGLVNDNDVYCVKKNIYYHTDSANTFANDDDIHKFAKIIADKIT